MVLHCRAFSGTADGLRQRDSAAFRGERPCRLSAGSPGRAERAAALLVTALTANVKLPVTHVEASRAALEQLRATGSVNSAPPGAAGSLPGAPTRAGRSWEEGAGQDIVNVAMGPCYDAMSSGAPAGREYSGVRAACMPAGRSALGAGCANKVGARRPVT